MLAVHTKSGTTIVLDIFRNVLIIVATGFAVFLIWNWIIPLIVAVPAYIVALNLFGFLTLPLYALSRKNSLKARSFRAFETDESEKGNAER